MVAAERRRARVVHDGGIEGLTEVMLPLDRQLDQLREEDVLLPTMPDGIAVTEYCEQLVDRTDNLFVTR